MQTDEVKVPQILINLLGNAAKFTSSGTVSLSVTRAGAVVHFAVKDTGWGIAAEDRERIFEAFTQIDSSLTRVSEGAGLGLPVSRQLARLLGGDLSVQSELGVGSTFTASLPSVCPEPASSAT